MINYELFSGIVLLFALIFTIIWIHSLVTDILTVMSTGKDFETRPYHIIAIILWLLFYTLTTLS